MDLKELKQILASLDINPDEIEELASLDINPDEIEDKECADVKVSLLFLTWPVYFPQLLRFKIPHLKI
jgi:hypothetical protein